MDYTKLLYTKEKTTRPQKQLRWPTMMYRDRKIFKVQYSTLSERFPFLSANPDPQLIVLQSRCPSLCHILTRHSATARSQSLRLKLETTSHCTQDISPPWKSFQRTWNLSCLHVHSNCHVFDRVLCVLRFCSPVWHIVTFCLIYGTLILT